MPVPAPAEEIDARDLTVRTWRFLEEEMKELGTPLRGPVVPVVDFIVDANKNHRTTPKERLEIIAQAELLFDHLYPHMPFKLENFKLQHPRDLLAQARAGVAKDSEAQFHGMMIAAFSRVRDAHTVYGCPPPWRGAVAFLPFQMCCIDAPGRRRRYFVSRVMKGSEDGGFGHPFFGRGAEILEWGGESIDTHVRMTAEWLPGGNIEAKYARASLAATLRGLTSIHPPFGDELLGADIRYVPEGSRQAKAIRLPWGVARFAETPLLPGAAFSMSSIQEELNKGFRMQCRESLREEQRTAVSDDPRAVSKIPEAFEFQFTGGPRADYPIKLSDLVHPQRPHARYAYLRIKSFRDEGRPFGMADRLVNEARRILTLLDEVAPDGLVIDVRGNPGGEIKAAERILQMLTPAKITPENFHYANTEAVVNILRRVRSREAPKDARLEFEKWLADADGKPLSDGGQRLTSGIPLTHPADCNDIGQVYLGPVVLLVDAFTYSAADIFAAGFQDHGIGFVLGADMFTGGGGANVWNHSELVTKLGPDLGLPLKPLPPGITMRLAMRRCSRVGFCEGHWIEDVGVRVNEVYSIKSVQDALDEFPGMVRRAVQLLYLLQHSRVDIDDIDERDGVYFVKVSNANVTSLRFFLDNHPAGARKAKPNATQMFRLPALRGRLRPSKLRVEGYLPGVRVENGVERRIGPMMVSARTFELRPPSRLETEEET